MFRTSWRSYGRIIFLCAFLQQYTREMTLTGNCVTAVILTKIHAIETPYKILREKIPTRKFLFLPLLRTTMIRWVV